MEDVYEYIVERNKQVDYVSGETCCIYIMYSKYVVYFGRLGYRV